MSALAEALLAAQRQAIGALSRAYVAERISGDQLLESLDLIGCKDALDQGLLLQSLVVVQTFGAEVPRPNGSKPDAGTEPANEAQLRYIADLANERGVLAPDGPLTKAQASKVIEQLKAGSYVADEWTAPF